MKNQEFHTTIEETLNSLDGIQRAEANPFLLTRVLEQMSTGMQNVVKPSLIWQASISLVVIISLNIAIGMFVTKDSIKP